MILRKTLNSFLILIPILLITGCVFDPSKFYPEPQSEKNKEPDFRYLYVDSLSNKSNQKLKDIISSSAHYNGRKIAIFSVDGALINQTPYYASDEAVYSYAKKHPTWKINLLKKMEKEDKDTEEYIKDKTLFWSGLTTEQVENFGYEILSKHYSFFPQVYDLISNLRCNNFEIWVITSSPEVLYQKFLSEYLNIPKNRIIGTKTIIKDGKLTEKLVPPFLSNNGKKEALETFIKTKPLIVVGHSYKDVNIINTSKSLRIIVNPDNEIKYKALGNYCVDEYAFKNKWIILDIKDIPNSRSTGMVSEEYNIKKNEPIDV
jgi:phosphoserine phosphatase